MTSTSTTTTTIRKSYGNRKVFTLPEDYALRSPRQRATSSTNLSTKKSEEINKLIKYIDENIVGKNTTFSGPFGRRKVIYCDYAASGRSLQFIEEYILREVLPNYGNTHSTTTSITSLQSTNFRQEARDIIKTACNASEGDAVIFTGHGCSDALQKLINALDIREAPIVFTSSSEHHDNLHLWQEIGAKLVRIGETKEGFLDLDELENQLKLHQHYGRQMIGCFSIASNITGIIIDDIACTILLHQYQALAFWDYNIAAPNITIDINPSIPGIVTTTTTTTDDDNNSSSSAYKDAIYFSGHKFIGGVQTPGILIAKKSIFRHRNSCETDGFFASQECNKSFEMQEEGSCAAIVESIRAGLVMQLKETVNVANILQRQEKINKQMLQHIRTIPEIILLGNTSPNLKRIPVFSFMVRHPRGTFLHHNFICAVLNDVFGIQARAGCPCSGAHLQDLLGIDACLADQYENILLEDRRLSSLNLGIDTSTLDLLRPGFTRISLPYFLNDQELAFIMEAVKMVATEGWKLLPQYIVNLDTGEWYHYTNTINKERKFLTNIRYIDGKMVMNERRISGLGVYPQTYSECLQTARNLFNRARKTANRNPYNDQGIKFDGRGEKLRWFMLQYEAQSILTSNAQNIKQKVPFDPITYNGTRRHRNHSNSHNDSRSDKDENHHQHQQRNHQIQQQSTTSGSPRHYSLPAIDDPRILTCSSPVPYFLQDVNGLYYPQINPQQPVSFAVGETVNSANLNHYQHQQQQQNFNRERCLSLGAPNLSPPILSPQTRVSLGMRQFRQRNYSYSSQNELHSLDSEANLSPTHSLTTCNYDYCGRNSPAPTPPDIQTYVTEMTKELATNIKSEIREVISRVEDVLENTDNGIDRSSYCCGGGNNNNNNHHYHHDRHGSGSEDGRSDSISANEVAEYLEKVSIEMANEVKSEIRDVVSAVDVFITPDNNEKLLSSSYSRTSSIGDDHHHHHNNNNNKVNVQNNEIYTPGSSSETVIHLINKSNSSHRLSDDDERTLENPYKNKLLTSTVTSVSSQDSGINLSFHEHDCLTSDYNNKTRSNSESLTTKQQSSNNNNNNEITRFATLQKQKTKQQKYTRTVSDSECFLFDTTNRPTTIPKTIWQSTVEALEEFQMIKNDDRVMVCLSGGKDSLTLLHTLIQYQNYIKKTKGVLFSIGAVTVDPDINNTTAAGCGGDHPYILMSHLRSLGVHYIIDDKKPQLMIDDGQLDEAKDNFYSFGTANLRHRLYSSAKCGGYNVLAIGQHLDDVCENFMLSMFHNGRLRTMRAHYYIKEHKLRVIRPFIYVREKSIRQFINNQHLPTTTTITSPDLITKERQRIKQVLTQQEILFPKLFISLRLALHPLIGFHMIEELRGSGSRCLKSKDNNNDDNNSNSSSCCTDDDNNETDEEPPVVVVSLLPSSSSVDST